MTINLWITSDRIGESENLQSNKPGINIKILTQAFIYEFIYKMLWYQSQVNVNRLSINMCTLGWIIDKNWINELEKHWTSQPGSDFTHVTEASELMLKQQS